VPIGYSSYRSKILGLATFGAGRADSSSVPAMTFSSAAHLSTLLTGWRELLQQWASEGRFTAAVLEALHLHESPQALQQLTAQLASGDPSELLQVELLDGDAMGGALGAYASGSGTIYLNASWLETADERAVLAVLTEELGHHLDALLNTADTPGDEGALLAQLLFGDGASPDLRARLATENDWGVVRGMERWWRWKWPTSPAPKAMTC
jgi:hypothetical protein